MRLTNLHRDLLIEHIDGVMLAVRREAPRRGIAVLLELGLVEYTDPTNPRPRYTRITALGRTKLAKILAEYAEVLTRLTEIVSRPQQKGFLYRNSKGGWTVRKIHAIFPVAGQGQTALAGTGEDQNVDYRRPST